MSELYNQILEVLEGTNEKKAMTLHDIADLLDAEQKKIAIWLKKMRISGEVCFEERKKKIDEKRTFSIKGKIHFREHVIECFYYWREI